MASPSGVLEVMGATRPEFRSAHEKVAFAIHAAFLDAGYSLIGAGPKMPLEEQDVGIEGWNAGDGVFTFLYSGAGRPDLPRSVVVRMVSIEDMLMMDAAPLGEADDHELEVPQGPFHLAIKVSDYAKETDAPNYLDQFKDLDGLVKVVNDGLISKLSKHRGPSANAGEGDPTEGRNSPWAVSEPEGRWCPAMYVPPISGIRGVTSFLKLGRRPRGLNEGMLVGPDDPRWGIHPSVVPGLPGEPAFVPPPGARFDPVLPPGGPAFDPNPFSRRPPGAPHPDVEHYYPF